MSEAEKDIPYLTEPQIQYVQVLEQIGDPSAAASICKVPRLTLERWRDDPDFNQAYTDAEERGNSERVAKALLGLDKNLESGKFEAVKFTLQSLRRDQYGANVQISVEDSGHRFIGFDGQPLHETPEEDVSSIERIEDQSDGG